MWQKSGVVLLAFLASAGPALAVRVHSFPTPVTLAQDADNSDNSDNAGDTSDELTGAGTALAYLQSATTLGAVANGLTNDADAASGIGFAAEMTTLYAYAQANPQAPYVDKDPGLGIDLVNYLAQYQITAQSGLDESTAKMIEPHGRQFLGGMQPLIDRWNAIMPTGGVPANGLASGSAPLDPVDVMGFTNMIPSDIASCFASVVSPTRVRLTPKDPKPGEPAMVYAILETDGVWRIDVPGIASVWQAKFLNSASSQPKPPKPPSQAIVPQPKRVPVPPANPAAAPLFEAINESQYAEVQRVMAKHPEWLNARNRFGETPLMKAVSDGDELIVALLLSQNVDLTAVDPRGLTARQRAISCPMYGPMPKSYGTGDGIPPSLNHIADLLLEHDAP
jgi:hypothetical protein